MKNNNLLRIAIDGPGGAGKSTIAKKVAKDLNIDYIDTGAMYRAIALKFYNEKTNIESEIEVKNLLENTLIDFHNGHIYLDGEIVDEEIRNPNVGMMASVVAKLSEVRKKLVYLQRMMGEKKSLVMDGRDIGTNVLVMAEIKIFMTASPEERAKRRYKELIDKGIDIEYKKVLDDIVERDYQDENRKLNPLKPADDSIILDTTDMDIDEVTNYILKEAEKWQN